LERVHYLASLLEVEPQLQVHIRKLSLGERMKLELMACLLHDPQIIFLDEPTIGLDLIAQRKIREFLLNYHRERGVTVILTSHYMADVTALCQRIVLVMNGEKHFDGPIRAFEGLMGQEKYVKFFFSQAQNEQHPLLIPWHPSFGNQGLEVELRVPEDKLKDVCAAILQNLPVTDFQTEKMPVERVMQELLSRTGA
jgi:ABC-2 type transport system ATP-binding protein